MVAQSTLGVGEWKAEAIALLQALPTELPEGFKENSAWYHAQIRQLLKVNPHSERARQLEAVLAGTAQVQHIQKTTNPFPSTRNGPNFFVPKGYKPNKVEEQVKLLLAWSKKNLDSDKQLDGSHAAEYAKSWGDYGQAYGLYVIPKPTKLAAKLNLDDPFGVDYGKLIELGPMSALSSQRKFHNYREGQMGLDRLRLVESPRKELRLLEETQPEGDLMVFPADTGTVYAGYRPDYSRWEIENAEPKQWPIDPYTGAWMVYCNKHRLARYEDLIMYCPGAKYLFEDSGGYSSVLFFRVHGDGLLYCSGYWSFGARDRWGPAFGVCR